MCYMHYKMDLILNHWQTFVELRSFFNCSHDGEPMTMTRHLSQILAKQMPNDIGVKHDIHIKPKSYKLELLGKLVV